MTDQQSEHTGNKYLRTIGKDGVKVTVDVYDILELFGVTCPALSHAAKKIICAGIRGKGNKMQDVTEARDAMNRAIELEAERNAN